MGTHPIFESDFDCLTDLNPEIMRYVAAYLLAQLGGNAAPSGDDIKSILSSVGVDADEERLNKVLSELSGKNVEDVIAEGKEKLASVPSGGAVAAGGAAAAVDAAPAEEEKKAESSESDSGDDDMGFGLFD